MKILAHFDHREQREQTLQEHSGNVAKYCEESCAAIGLASLGRLTGLLHDSGKGSSSFQNYLMQNDILRRGDIPHAFCGARYSYENWGLDGSLKGITAQFIAAAICSHHSGLPNVTGITGEDCLRQRAWPKREANYEEALQNYFAQSASKNELDMLFQEAVKEIEKLIAAVQQICKKLPAESQLDSMLFILGMVQRYLLSSLIDADRYDTYLFEANEQPPEKADLNLVWQKFSIRLEQYLKRFPSQTPIDQKRKEISEQCLSFSKNGAGVYRLSVPTGSGKTISSLRFALNCCVENSKCHIYYIAPYKSILEQNADEIRKAISNPDGSGTDSLVDSIVLEHHSDVVIENKDGKEENKDELKRYQLLTQRWECPMILTTSVQFLNTLFDGRSACVRRLHSLANSVIILDEAQAMPVKCTYLLNAALNFLAYVCNCSVVLCTATQPESEKLRMPVISGEPSQMTENMEETFAAFRRTRVVDKSAEGSKSADELADFTMERSSDCDNVLLILNTKSAAAGLYRAITARMEELPREERIPVYYLTTSLCPAHRMEKIQNIHDALAMKASHGNRLICISTQLIEAGVNLSFQCVIRSLAGLDSIAQAAGRCNRHGEADCRNVFIVKCGDENLSSLPDIAMAQQAAAHILENYKDNSAQFDNDLLSPKAVRRYYNYYFLLQQNQLGYPVGPKNDPELYASTTLFDLLSRNRLAAQACGEKHTALPQHPMHQAFETAGDLFEAIEKGGMDVIVPYGEGNNLITELNSYNGIGELAALLRKIQPFSVHLFDGEKKKLSEMGAIDFPPSTGVAVLREGFYDKNLGVQLRRGEMDLLLLG